MDEIADSQDLPRGPAVVLEHRHPHRHAVFDLVFYEAQ